MLSPMMISQRNSDWQKEMDDCKYFAVIIQRADFDIMRIAGSRYTVRQVEYSICS